MQGYICQCLPIYMFISYDVCLSVSRAGSHASALIGTSCEVDGSGKESRMYLEAALGVAAFRIVKVSFKTKENPTPSL